MPSKSLAQDRFVRAKAAEGSTWAKKWIADEHGMKIPRIQHVERSHPFTSKPKASDVRRIRRRRKKLRHAA